MMTGSEKRARIERIRAVIEQAKADDYLGLAGDLNAYARYLEACPTKCTCGYSEGVCVVDCPTQEALPNDALAALQPGPVVLLDHPPCELTARVDANGLVENDPTRSLVEKAPVDTPRPRTSRPPKRMPRR